MADQGEPSGAETKRSRLPLVAALAAIALVLGGVGYVAFVYLDARVGCPSAAWASELGAEIQALVPTAAGPGSVFVSDCDDRRAVTVSVDDVGDAGIEPVLAAVAAAGWAPTSEPGCLEKDVAGEQAHLWVSLAADGSLTLIGLRGPC